MTTAISTYLGFSSWRRAIPPPTPAADSQAPGFAASLSNATRTQLHTLVSQTFLSPTHKAVRHIVVFGVNEDDRIREICHGIAEILASQTTLEIAIVNAKSSSSPITAHPVDQIPGVEGTARQISRGLWQVDADVYGERWDIHGRDSCIPAQVRHLQSEFDCSVTHAPPAEGSFLGVVMGSVSDGVILVLQANKTRRAAARNVMQVLRRNRVRILGVVLDGRTFPVPSRLYHKV